MTRVKETLKFFHFRQEKEFKAELTSNRFRRDLESDALIRQKRVKRSYRKRFEEDEDDDDEDSLSSFKRKRDWRKRLIRKRGDDSDEFDFNEIRQLLAREQIRRMLENEEKRSYRRRKRN